MKLSKNLVIGIASSIWSAAVNLIVVPLYIRYLGIEAYGLIGFFAMAQAMVLLLDAGLSATMNREVARQLPRGFPGSLPNLLRTLASVYWGVALAIAAITVMFAPSIADGWLSSHQLSKETMRTSVTLLGIVIACRWPIGLYQGVLLGAHRQAMTSAINVGMTTLSAAGAITVLANVSNTIEAFFAWQAAVGLTHALVMCKLAWKTLNSKMKPKFELSELRRIGKFTAGVSGVAITGMLLMQGDKVILSKILNLDSFGQYMLASVLASGLYIILTPTFNLIYPRLTSLYASQGQNGELVDYYRRGTRLLVTALFPFSVVAIAFAGDILFLWTKDRSLSESATPLVRLFLIGTTLNGVMHFPYALQLASGNPRLPAVINVALLLMMIPLTTYLTINYGAQGGAAAWATLNFFFVVFGTWLTHRYVLKGIGLRWLVYDVVCPLALAVISVGAICIALNQLSLPRLALLAFAATAAAAFALAGWQSERLRLKHSSLSGELAREQSTPIKLF